MCAPCLAACWISICTILCRVRPITTQIISSTRTRCLVLGATEDGPASDTDVRAPPLDCRQPTAHPDWINLTGETWSRKSAERYGAIWPGHRSAARLILA